MGNEEWVLMLVRIDSDFCLFFHPHAPNKHDVRTQGVNSFLQLKDQSIIHHCPQGILIWKFQFPRTMRNEFLLFDPPRLGCISIEAWANRVAVCVISQVLPRFLKLSELLCISVYTFSIDSILSIWLYFQSTGSRCYFPCSLFLWAMMPTSNYFCRSLLFPSYELTTQFHYSTILELSPLLVKCSFLPFSYRYSIWRGE